VLHQLIPTIIAIQNHIVRQILLNHVQAKNLKHRNTKAKEIIIQVLREHNLLIIKNHHQGRILTGTILHLQIIRTEIIQHLQTIKIETTRHQLLIKTGIIHRLQVMRTEIIRNLQITIQHLLLPQVVQPTHHHHPIREVITQVQGRVVAARVLKTKEDDNFYK